MNIFPFASRTLSIDISLVESIVDIATRRDSGFHILAGVSANLWIAENMLKKAQELLEEGSEAFVRIDDGFDADSIETHK